MSRALIVIAIILVVMGALWPWLQKTGLGRLPGDVVVEKENFRLYIPITSAIIISVVLSVLLWFFRR